MSWPTEDLAAALRTLLPIGAALHVTSTADCTIVDIAARGQDVLVIFQWMAYPHLLGFAIGTDSEYGDSPADWASDARVWLQEELGTGLVVQASRHQHDGIIELGARSWPNDRRFSASSAGPDDPYAWRAIGFFERDGFDTTAVRELRTAGTLITWERVYVNNRHGGPYVGHAAAARIDADTARLVFLEAAPDVPATVALSLCLSAAHVASWHGAARIVTAVEHPVLDILGFQPIDGERQLTTDFLHRDAAAAERLLAESQSWRETRRIRSRRFRVTLGGGFAR